MNGMTDLLLILTVALPLGLIAVVPLVARPLRLLPWAALPGLATAVLAPVGTAIELPVLLIGLTLALDATAALFLGFGALLWALAGAYAIDYLRKSTHTHLFATFWLLTLAGNLGTFIAADVVTFYLSFSIMSLSAYGLVIHDRTPSARRAGRIYIILAILGEGVLIAALMLAASGAASLAFADVRAVLASSATAHWVLAGLIVGFGIKAGLVPLHVWLPLAHPQAPTPASAVLSGVIVKAGIIGLVRLLPDVGLWPGWSLVLISVGLFTAGYGVVAGLLQRDAKAVLAYSTLSQMGLVVTVLGAALTVPSRAAHLDAATLYVIHHGLAKGALFLGVGVVAAVSTTWRRPALLVLGVTALAIAGLPLSGGALAKLAIKAPLGAGPVTTLAGLSALGTALLMLRFLQIVARGSQASHLAGTRLMVTAWSGAIAAAFVLPWLLFETLTGTAPTINLTPDKLWDAAWPIVLAAAVAVASLRVGARLPALPQGDLVVFLEHLVRRVAAVFLQLRDRTRAVLAELPRPWHIEVPMHAVDLLERAVQRWQVAGLLIALLALAIVASLLVQVS